VFGLSAPKFFTNFVIAEALNSSSERSRRSARADIVAYGGILAVIVTSYLLSWWLLILGPIAFIIGSKITKNAYNEAILTSAIYSEIIFCFMYYARIVSIEAGGEHYYHKTD
jgi:hypothetical protein